MGDVPILVCTAGELTGKRIPVPEGGLGIGRSGENAVVIDDDGVSRYHGRLLFENGSLWLQDAGSRNGVFVNGVRVTGHKALKVGDSITIAKHTFELRWQDEDNLPDPPPSIRPDRDSRVTKNLNDRRATLPPTPSDALQRDAGRDPRTSDPTSDPAPRRRWYWPFS